MLFPLYKKSAEDIVPDAVQHRGRSEVFNLRSSQFKICFMAQQQEITRQYDLFSRQSKDVTRPFPESETVRGAFGTKALQVKEAGGHERTLTHGLMSLILSADNIKEAYKQVKRNKGAAGIDQMPVGGFAEWYSQHGETLLSEFHKVLTDRKG